MLVPNVGSPGGKRELPVTNNLPGASDVSELAQDTLETAVFKAKEFDAEKKIPNKKEAQKAEKVAFTAFEKTNEANAKP